MLVRQYMMAESALRPNLHMEDTVSSVLLAWK